VKPQATVRERSLRYEQLRRLTEISRALTYTTDLDQVLRIATERATELLGADRSLLMLLDSDGLLQVASTHGVDLDDVRRFRQPMDETLGSRVQALLRIVPPDFFVGVPLVANGAVKGLLGVVRCGLDSCTEEEEWLLSALADQVALALETSRLQGEIRLARREGAVVSEEAGLAGDEKDRALATLSHDIRSPLNAIDSYAELLEMEILGPVTDRQREALGRIRMGGRHLLAVLQNVLEMARIEAGAVRVNAAQIDLAKVVDEAVFMVRHSAVSKGQELRSLVEVGVTAQADPDRLRQVLINLVGNAIKYTPSKGTITVRVGVEEGSWGTISVEDDGPGIAPKYLEAIFRPYFRVERTDEDGSDGAGLGLAISKELVHQMGGRLDVRSEVGRGSLFTIKLPLVVSQV
jgi:phosphoserine phosphatase RsbU/P